MMSGREFNPEFIKKFQTAEEMLDYLKTGQDLYNVVTNQYCFVYNDWSAIAVYELSDERASVLAKDAKKYGTYWGGLLGPGGRIYDAPDNPQYTPAVLSNIDFCKEVFDKGNWIDTADFCTAFNISIEEE